MRLISFLLTPTIHIEIFQTTKKVCMHAKSIRNVGCIKNVLPLMQALVALQANLLSNAHFLLDNKFSKEKCLLTTLGILLEFLSRNAFLRSVFEAILRNVASVVQWPLRPLSGLLLRGALLPRFDTFHQAAKAPQRRGSPREMLQIEK